MNQFEEALRRLAELKTVEEDRPAPRKPEPKPSDPEFERIRQMSRVAIVFHLYMNEIRMDINAKQPNDDVILAMAKTIEQSCQNIPTRAFTQFFKAVRTWKRDKGGFNVPSVGDYEYCADLVRNGRISLPLLQTLSLKSFVANIPMELKLTQLPHVKTMIEYMVKTGRITLSDEFAHKVGIDTVKKIG